jgi:hypothetical protein
MLRALPTTPREKSPEQAHDPHGKKSISGGAEASHERWFYEINPVLTLEGEHNQGNWHAVQPNPIVHLDLRDNSEANANRQRHGNKHSKGNYG